MSLLVYAAPEAGDLADFVLNWAISKSNNKTKKVSQINPKEPAT